MSTFYDALPFFCIKFYTNNFTNSNFLLWFSKDLIEIVFLKRKAHAILKQLKKLKITVNLLSFWSKYKFISREGYKKYIESIEHNIFSNSKEFWGIVKKNKSAMSLLKFKNLNVFASKHNKNVVDLFLKYFRSVYALLYVAENLSVYLTSYMLFLLATVVFLMLVMR